MTVRRRTTAAIAVATTVAALLGVRLVQEAEQRAPVTQQWEASAAYEIPATQDLQYRLMPPSRTTWGPAQQKAEALAVVKTVLKAHAGEGFQLRPKGGDWSQVRDLPTTVTILSLRLDAARVGDVWAVRAVKDGFVEKVLKVDLNPAMVIDTEGTLAVDIIVGTTVTKFPDVYGLGIYVCKYISGTRTLSQHAFANAVDFGGTLALLDKVAAYQEALVAKGYLPISQLLWRVPGHYSHIHDSGDPLLSGSTCRRAD